MTAQYTQDPRDILYSLIPNTSIPKNEKEEEDCVVRESMGGDQEMGHTLKYSSG